MIKAKVFVYKKIYLLVALMGCNLGHTNYKKNSDIKNRKIIQLISLNNRVKSVVSKREKTLPRSEFSIGIKIGKIEGLKSFHSS